MSEIGQANPAVNPAAWVERVSAPSAKIAPSLPGMALALLVLLTAAVLVGGLWLHSEVSDVLQVHTRSGSHSSPSASDLQSFKELRHWQLAATLFTATCGVILIAFGVAGYRRIESHWERIRERQEFAEKRIIRDLRAQLSDKQKVEIGLREQHQELTSQFESLSRTYNEAKAESNRVRLAEEVFSYQKRELVRSKDVLELHVQARTQQLHKLQRNYELILNSAGEGICGMDAEGKITFVNPAGARMMAAQVSDLVGQPVAKAFPDFTATPLPDENRPSDQPTAEVSTTRRDGTTFGAEFVRTPIHENDRLVGEVLLFKDITERKHAAETLAHKAEELTRSNKELEQFAFVASHDLQEPLRKIQAFGDRLKTKCAAVNLEEGRDYLDRMQSAAARMQTLIFDLLTFSRVISRIEPFTPIDLNTVARDVVADLEVRIEKTGGQVEVGDLPTIEGDSTQMRQLMQNLIGNALKFHAPGNPPVVRVEAQMLPQSPYSPGDGTGNASIPLYELRITDNGIGFDEKYLDKIFAVFQRLHGRQEYEGTGIGLAVCRRIVERHGGTITAISKPDEGATFIITLPARQATKEKKGTA